MCDGRLLLGSRRNALTRRYRGRSSRANQKRLAVADTRPC
jgi:hypothetical protein